MTFHPNKAAIAAIGIPAALLVGIRLRYPTIRDDIALIRKNLDAVNAMKDFMDRNQKVVDIFDDQAQSRPNKPFILYKDECHTFGQVDHDANKLAHYMQESGLQLGDTVAFVLPNAPVYVSSFLACNKIGVTAAFANYNLKHQALVHCIQISEAKAVLCSKEYIQNLQDIQEDIERLNIKIWVIGCEGKPLPPGFMGIDLSNMSAEPIPREIRKSLTMSDPAVYMYTSGTTGLPKAVTLTHSRMVKAMFISHPCDFTSDDVIYCPLPIYHGTGFLFGVCSAIRLGCAVAIAPKFSASHYWDDVRRYRATGILYIGELCRYLLAQLPRHDDGKYPHTVRIAVGNGLRPDIWAQFKKRFNIEHIREFYAATEGNFIAMNLDDKEGTVGRYPKLVHDLLGNAQIIKCDMATAEPIRGKNGQCIPQPSASKETNEKKIIHDVIKKGDQYFNTGDLMMIDNNGYVYFCDRLGDTFRWKGENVATTEVAEELNKFPGILDSNVYGVKIPGQDGRAGMAAITMKDEHNLDPQQLFKHATDNLPSYACPKFLRILPQLVITSTFKHRKTDLLKEGFDPAVVSDPLYFMDVGKKSYVPLDRQVFQTIVAGKAKL